MSKKNHLKVSYIYRGASFLKPTWPTASSIFLGFPTARRLFYVQACYLLFLSEGSRWDRISQVEKEQRSKEYYPCEIEILLSNEFLMLSVQLLEKRGEVKLRNKRRKRWNISWRKPTSSRKTSGVTESLSSSWRCCFLAYVISAMCRICKQQINLLTFTTTTNKTSRKLCSFS